MEHAENQDPPGKIQFQLTSYFWVPFLHNETLQQMTTPDPSFLRARYLNQSSSVQFSSITQLYPTVCNPWTVESQASLSITKSQSLLKLISVELVMPSNQLILCLPLLLLPSIFPSIRVFSHQSFLCISWPNYWSFSFSISPSNEYSGPISLRMD